MNGFGMTLGALLCGASLAAGAASVASVPVHGDKKVCLHVDVPSPAANIQSGACSDATAAGAGARIALQYALHRSRLYLYNPERTEPLARAGDRPAAGQQVGTGKRFNGE
jgi:hypothetical protein